MSETFNSMYAGAYDLLYGDKNYTAECDLLEHLFQRYSPVPVKKVLDLGCGTGNHAISLARRGYQVVGLDRSESMLAQARTKAENIQGTGYATFHEADIRDLILEDSFETAIMMFAVLSYQTDNNDVLATLKSIRKHLVPGGLLLFDVWYGPAVLYQKPSLRTKEVQIPGAKIIRTASGELDVNRHLCKVRFEMRKLVGDQTVEETVETHMMRYFFPLELKLYLESSGFTPIRLGAFPLFDQDPGEETWNVLQIARAI